MVTYGPMAEPEPGKAAQSPPDGPAPCGQSPVSEAFPGWPLIPGGPPREKIVSLPWSLGSQVRLPVGERIKGCIVGKGHGLVTGLIGSEVH